MKLRNNLLYLVVLLLIASLFLVACERPLPGGYNDPDAGSETTVPEVPENIPGVDSEAYPAEAAPAEAAPADTEAYPAEAVEPAEAYPAEEGAVDQEVMTEGEEAAPEAEQAEEAVDAEAPVEETADEAAAEGEAAADEGAAEEPAATPGTHTVATGENLYRIGLLYGISWLDLAEANGITDPANLSVGQVLTIPGADTLAEEVVDTEEAADAEAAEEVVEEAEAADAEAAEEVAEEAEATEEVVEEAEATEESAEAEVVEEGDAAEESAAEAEAPDGEDAGTAVTYIVQQGDNLYRIGVNFGLDWTEIAAANGIIGGEIYPGQELIIPAAADSEAEAEASEAEAGETEAVEAAEGEISYVVQEGDSIYSIAFEHGIPWTALVESNNIEAPYTLEVGQTLVIVVPVVE